MSSKPLVGISSYREQASWGVWSMDAAMLPYAYVDQIAKAGGVPLLLPPVSDRQAAETAIAALDALVLAGGPDIEPARYAAEPHAETADVRPQRDAWELNLLAAALDRDLPVLAICRGAQILNVACGGTLRQHLPEAVGHDEHRPARAVFGTTKATLDTDALPGLVLGASVSVPCYHHQAVDELGSGLVVTGEAPDGTVEALRLSGRAFVVGVQWHPEMGDDPRLFSALIEAARS